MLQEAFQFKQEFLKNLKNYNIPFHNRAICFYTLAQKLGENPTNTELRNLLITAICDAEFLLYHFLPEPKEEYMIENYRTTRLRINAFHKAWKQENILEELWKQICKRKTLPNIDNLPPEMETTINNEVNNLWHLYRTYFKVSEKESLELRNNLEHFISLSYSYNAYHSIAPFFFYQIMVKHTKRIASKENFQFSPKNLWEYKEYQITRNNEKNYDTYEKNARLFLELCAYYELFPDVNIDLCKYAFSCTSNLIEWLDFYDQELASECKSPLALFWEELDLSYQEPYEPESYDFYSIYDISDENDLYYNDVYFKEYFEIEETVRNYLLEHPEYILSCMEDLYKTPDSLTQIVETMYHEITLLEELYPDEVPLSYRLGNLYFLIMTVLDEVVFAKIQGVFS